MEPLTAIWPEPKELPGRYVKLLPLRAELHGEDLWKVLGGPHNAALWQYMPEGPFTHREAFDAAICQAQSQTDPLFFAIVDSSSRQALGRCAFLNIKPNHRTIEVGHLIYAPQLQRTRGATETFYLLAKYAFDELQYRRLEWKCNALNARSRSAALRLGFRFEGIFRQHMIIKGRNRDSAWFSIIDQEWPTVKAALEDWLADENFDERGTQRKRLVIAN